MVCEVYYGDISEARQKKWNSGDDNPFEVLGDNTSLIFCDWITFLPYASKHFSDEIQMDWGSYAYKCYGRDLLELMMDNCCTGIENSASIQPEKEYGVVFIEIP